MIKKKIARRYSQALYETALSAKLAEKINKDLQGILKTIESSKDLKLFLQTPIINPGKKMEILDKLFSHKVNKLTMNFMELLTRKKRENYLYDICVDFIDLMNEKKGIIEAQIRTAVSLTENERKKLSQTLKSYVGKEISASYSVDKSIKGGMVAQFKDTIIDASIKRQLEILQKKMTEGSFL